MDSVSNAPALRDDEGGEGIQNIVVASGGEPKFAVELALVIAR